MPSTKRVVFHPSFENERDKSLYREAIKLVQHLREAGFQAYFAGGAVRDMVMKRPLTDIDIATDGSIDALKALFPKAILVGAQFGVLRVIRHRFEFEIATFRTESNYLDGRHPSHVEKASTYEEDAQRRDFTINGLFFDPAEEMVLDCVGGLDDIFHKQLRTIGSPHERFKEDRLRVIRAVRFSRSLDFPIQQETEEAMKEFADSVIQHVSGERIWNELSKMASLSILASSLTLMHSIGLFRSLFPFVREETEWRKRVSLLEGVRCSLPLGLSLLFYDVDQFPLWTVEKFHISHKEFLLLNQFQMLYRGFSKKHISEMDIVDLLALSFSEEILPVLAILLSSDWLPSLMEKRKELMPWIEQRRSKKYSIDGKTLLERGISPGKRVGELMERAFELSLRKKLLVKEELLREVMGHDI